MLFILSVILVKSALRALGYSFHPQRYSCIQIALSRKQFWKYWKWIPYKKTYPAVPPGYPAVVVK